LATGAALVALILAFGPLSGAHFNPVVTVAQAGQGALRPREVLPYVIAQLTGAVVGVAVADAMFGEPLFALSTRVRAGWGQGLSEFIATFGLLTVVSICARRQPRSAAYAVGSYIMAAYWFTASTSFANPAVTFARSLTNTFAGIRLTDVPAFIIAQAFGGGTAMLLSGWLLKAGPARMPRTAESHCLEADREAS
jgi:glycerol uptake facilitator-like aquaporin